MNSGSSVALVFPSGHFFNTPCVPSLALQLADKGFDVDIYLLRNITAPTGEMQAKRVRLYWCPIAQRDPAEPGVLRSLWFACWAFAALLRRRRAQLVIACGLRGLLVVGLLSYFMPLRFAYNSLEIYTGKRFDSFVGKVWKRVEAALNRRAQFTVIQDEGRAALLARVNHLADHRFLLFPNAPLPVDRQAVDVVVRGGRAPAVDSARAARERGEHIVLYAGSLSGTWTGFEALARIAEFLPDGWRLLMQSRISDAQARASIQSITSRLGARAEVFTEPLALADYQALVCMADIGLAWYDTHDDNLKYVGLSSGKIAQYWQAGCPVIVNRIPIYEEACNQYQCGVIVDTVDLVPDAVRRIAQSAAAYRAGASQAYQALFDMNAYSEHIAAAVAEFSGRSGR